MKIESGTSDFPPEGPKIDSYVERDTFKKIENWTLRPARSSRGRPISPQRVRKKKVKSNYWVVWLGLVGLGWVGLGWVGLGWCGLGWCESIANTYKWMVLNPCC